MPPAAVTLRRVALALCLCGLLALLPQRGAWAQEKLPAAVAVVVDYARILRDSKAAKSIRDQIESRRKVFQDQIAKEEKRLFDADKELGKQRSVLSPEAFAEKRKAFEQDVMGVQRMAQDRRRQLDQVAAAALGNVRNSLIEVVSALADERSFNIVLPSSTVLLFSPKIDLTDEVMARLDKKLPSVKVPDKPPAPPKN